MPNLYGVANPVLLPIMNQLASDVSCPSSTETPIFGTSPLIAPSQGFFYPIIWVSAWITLGATAPSPMAISFHLNAGSNVDGQWVPASMLTASGNVTWSTVLLGVASQIAWQSPGSTISVTINPAGQAVTAKANSTRAVIALFRAPDQ